MKRLIILCVVAIAAYTSVSATESWPTTTEVGKFNVSTSWPTSAEQSRYPFPKVESWPLPKELSVESWPFPVNSWPKFPESRDSSTKEKRHPAER